MARSAVLLDSRSRSNAPVATATAARTAQCTAPIKFGHFSKLSPIKNGQLLKGYCVA